MKIMAMLKKIKVITWLTLRGKSHNTSICTPAEFLFYTSIKPLHHTLQKYTFCWGTWAWWNGENHNMEKGWPKTVFTLSHQLLFSDPCFSFFKDSIPWNQKKTDMWRCILSSHDILRKITKYDIWIFTITYEVLQHYNNMRHSSYSLYTFYLYNRDNRYITIIALLVHERWLLLV